MIRKATRADIPAISRIYEHIHDLEEAGKGQTGWKRGVYPTEAVALRSLERDELFVDEREERIIAAARINREQEDGYKRGDWAFPAEPGQVMVLHTLVVEPACKGRGAGRNFVAFYEDYARKNGCAVLRMDTNERNIPARALYHRLGYREAGVIPCDFNGLQDIRLVLLEKKLP